MVANETLAVKKVRRVGADEQTTNKRELQNVVKLIHISPADDVSVTKRAE